MERYTNKIGTRDQKNLNSKRKHWFSVIQCYSSTRLNKTNSKQVQLIGITTLLMQVNWVWKLFWNWTVSLPSVITLSAETQPLPDNYDTSKCWWRYTRPLDGKPYSMSDIQRQGWTDLKEKAITPVMRNHLTYSSYNTSYKLIVIANLSKCCQKDCWGWTKHTNFDPKIQIFLYFLM